MCYFLTVGASTSPWRLDALLSEPDLLEVDTTLEPATIQAFFPAEDAVRRLTHRGCSCSLVAPTRAGDVAASSSVSLTPPCRRAITSVARAFGAVRLYARTRRDFTTPTRGRLDLTLAQFLAGNRALPTNVLVEISARLA